MAVQEKIYGKLEGDKPRLLEEVQRGEKKEGEGKGEWNEGEGEKGERREGGGVDGGCGRGCRTAGRGILLWRKTIMLRDMELYQE